MRGSRWFLMALLWAPAALADWNFGWEDEKGQGIWSGSDPQDFTVGSKPCDYKVRGRSGVWADFEGDMPAGRKVIGVVNPREPDIIFFQLKKQSPFLFAAKRTCFEGETPYVEDKAEADKHKKLQYPLVFASYLNIRNSQRVDTDEVVTSLTNDYCAGGGYEWVDGYYRIWAGGCLGFGSFGSTSSKTGRNTDFDSEKSFLIPRAYLGGFYDLPDTPYAAGLEFTMGFGLSRTSLVNSDTTTSSFDFVWSLGMAWRFYYKNWMFVPKFGVYDGLRPKFLELQIGYLFQ